MSWPFVLLLISVKKLQTCPVAHTILCPKHFNYPFKLCWPCPKLIIKKDRHAAIGLIKKTNKLIKKKRIERHTYLDTQLE